MTTITIDLSLPVIEQWRQYQVAQAELSRIIRESKPRGVGKRRKKAAPAHVGPDPVESLKPHDVITVAGEGGEFRIDRIDERGVHVWGGEKNRQKHRSFAFDRQFFRTVKPEVSS